MSEETKPKKKYECKTCGSVITIDRDEDIKEKKCIDCKKANYVPFSMEYSDDDINKLDFSREFKQISKIIETYMDIPPEYITLVAVWIIGTYLHKQFPTYPYLYINAMKGSGKTRLLGIISNLSRNGKIANALTEAVLFRTAALRTFCIDEFEKINAKGNENLKLLLNSAYKRGGTVERMEKRKEEFVPVEFSVYCPISLANIWGMDNVLSDRCIKIVLERSDKKRITRLIANFENDDEFFVIKKSLIKKTRNFDQGFDLFGDMIKDWNNFVMNNVVSVDNVVSVVISESFPKIEKLGISGRDLELFMPLFIVGCKCGKGILDDLLELSKNVIKEKRNIDREENIDVQIFEFVAQWKGKDLNSANDFISVNGLTEEFRNYLGSEEKWLNSRFLGRGLRRLKLIRDEKRTSRHMEVKLNIAKAKEKLLMFKEIVCEKCNKNPAVIIDNDKILCSNCAYPNSQTN